MTLTLKTQMPKTDTLTKGERTKQQIIEQVAPLFNAQGYFGTSLSDVLEVTGLPKGTIYRYFESKDDLALAAFDFAYARLREKFAKAIRENKNTVKRLLAIITEYSALLDDPYLYGGCPIFNTAVEGDDAHPVLLERARQAMDEWRNMIHITIRKGKERKEMKQINEDEVASVLISAIEGAIVMAKLYKDKKHIRRTVEHLKNYVQVTVAR
jgi:TetR/AcrR family transcriptional regulator, transcriptional repressor for nem operon